MEVDYTGVVSRVAPKGLCASAAERLEVGGLMYETLWTMDTGVDTMLTRPGRKRRMVRVTCSECGCSMLCEYISGEKKGCYGFIHPEDYPGEYKCYHGDDTCCPMCNSPVIALCSAIVAKKGYAVTDDTTALSVDLLPGESGDRTLVLTGWKVQQRVNRYGDVRLEAQPLEAYVFEREKVHKLNGWQKTYSGTAGYFMTVSDKWRQPYMWSESWGLDSYGIYGLTPELLAESCLHNSKLDIYMNDWRPDGYYAPVEYLILYQMHPQIENLVVHGCGYIIDGLIYEKMRNTEWSQNHYGRMELPELNLLESRPAQMLWLDKDEFAKMREMRWDLFHWQVYSEAKKTGDVLKIPEDVMTLHEYGGEDVLVLVGRAPVGKCVRYLLDQMYQAGAAMDVYNEYVDPYCVCDDPMIDAHYLVDYWDMAEYAGWNLQDASIRFPKNLINAHERAREARGAKLDTELRSRFKERATLLSKYEFSYGNLIIKPARTQKELNREGEKLKHCVAGYARKHANGETAIFFIRHAEKPNVPYFTLEYDEKNNKVCQNRGKRNCARTKEVKEFEKEWLKWIAAGCPNTKEIKKERKTA